MPKYTFVEAPQWQPSSAIAQHLLEKPDCLEQYNESMFSVLCRARNASVLHFLEPLFIINVEPEICKQLEFVKSLTVFAHLCGKSKPASANPK